MNIAASWLASTTPLHYWCKSMAQMNQAITFWVLVSLNVCPPLSKCTHMHTHRFADKSCTESWKEMLAYAQSAGDLCCVSCPGWPSAHVPAPWMKPFTGAGLWTAGLRLAHFFPLFLQMIFQHAESGAKDEICPNRSSLICQPWNDTRTRSWWKVTLISVEMERHRPLLDEEWRCIVSQLNGQTVYTETIKTIFFYLL